MKLSDLVKCYNFEHPYIVQDRVAIKSFKYPPVFNQNTNLWEMSKNDKGSNQQIGTFGKLADDWNTTIINMRCPISDVKSELLEALERYESFFTSMFNQCCSNPVYNTWGKTVDLTLLNEAHYLAKKALGE